MMDQHKSFPEIASTEKQMLALIYSKGILHEGVLELYHKIRGGYENILLNSNQMDELQDVEYHLWKIHYQLIDEFRKRFRQRSYRAENSDNDSQRITDIDLERYNSFLSEATEFYKKLIVVFRRNCGLPAEVFFKSKDYTSFSVEPTKLQACQHTCHRLLICLGDLARYSELVKKGDTRDWSAVATYYLEATRTWPDSGNPHNQLALLARYVADSFLALYHCVRSLAVKEPFPDAWRNIMLLFDENRSTKLTLLSSQMQFNFLNPSKRSYVQNAYHEDDISVDDVKLEAFDDANSGKFDFWPVLVRTISFFLVRSSLEDFPSTLASALNSLEAILALDDAKLSAALESYHNMDSSRKGPYRAIQLISIFIFIIHSLTNSPEIEKSPGKDYEERSQSVSWAFVAIFICMGRIAERCMKESQRDNCPLLPAVLVFLEWLVGALDTVEAYHADERVRNAFSYFFVALADLLDRIPQNEVTNPSIAHYALWEDHELRGFYPLTRVHERLDFVTHMECMDDYNWKNQYRLGRIVHATKIIVETRKSSHDWIPCDRVERLLNSVNAAEIIEIEPAISSSEVKGLDELSDTSPRNEENVPEKNEFFSCQKIQPSIEEEEVILFKPITRRNSAPAPLYISKPAADLVSPEGTQKLLTPNDEWLRRATSLSSGQDMEDAESFTFCSTVSSSGSNRSSEKESHPVRPPSLSAWVLSQGSPNVETEKGTNTFIKQKLTPINEIPFSELSIHETKTSVMATEHISPFVTPTPSAPLLPDDNDWSRKNPLIPPDYKAHSVLGAAPLGYTNRPPVRPPIPGLVDGFHPPFLGMSSSEWLYHYRNSQNMQGYHLSPVHFNSPSFHPNELSSSDLCDQWGNRFVSNPMLYLGNPQLYPSSTLVYGPEDQKREKFFLGYQRPFPYVCGVGMELSSEQPSPLEYLKERERQLQPAAQLRNPTFMGN